MIGFKEFVKKQFNTENYTLVTQFAMLHAGWGCDETVVLILVDDKHFAIGSNHGSPCVLNKSDLLDKAREYTDVLNATLKAAQNID